VLYTARKYISNKM